MGVKEEGTDFGGYFVVNGIERVVRMLIQPRRHYIMALRRSAYRKRGSSYTDMATVLRYALQVAWHGLSTDCRDRTGPAKHAPDLNHSWGQQPKRQASPTAHTAC